MWQLAIGYLLTQCVCASVLMLESIRRSKLKLKIVEGYLRIDHLISIPDHDQHLLRLQFNSNASVGHNSYSCRSRSVMISDIDRELRLQFCCNHKLESIFPDESQAITSFMIKACRSMAAAVSVIRICDCIVSCMVRHKSTWSTCECHSNEAVRCAREGASARRG